MIVSLEAIFLSCFVLISQNRQAQKDKVRADIEYEVNIKAELEIAHLHEKTDRIYENMMARFEKSTGKLRRVNCRERLRLCRPYKFTADVNPLPWVDLKFYTTALTHRQT
jgi:uncharacterized membrane protein